MLFYFFLTFFLIILIYFLLGKKTEDRFLDKKRHWLICGISLFAVKFSITTPLLFSGVFHSNGLSGMWFIWSKYLIAGVLPFLIAPLWLKLDLKTDNEFVLKRFSGPSARYLQLFRAIYVGFFICSLILSFQVLAMVKFLKTICAWEEEWIYLILVFIVLILSYFNYLRNNLLLENIQAVFFFIILLVFFTMVVNTYDIQEAIYVLNDRESGKLDLVKAFDVNFLVFIIVNALFVQLFDGSGIDAQRYYASDAPNQVWKIAVTSTVLLTLFNFIIFLFLIIGWANFPDSGIQDGEMLIVHYFEQFSDGPFMALITIFFSAIFLSSIIGLINWGASYISVDVYTPYLKERIKLNEKKVNHLIVVSISVMSLLIAYFNQELDFIVKLILNLTAGVAPVFVLRWFWMRINAWSQISAMVSGALYAGLYYLILDNSDFEMYWCEKLNIGTYALKIYILSFCTTLTWLLVTFLTPKDDPVVIENFKSTVLQDVDLKKGLLHTLLYTLLIVLFFVFLFGYLI